MLTAAAIDRDGWFNTGDLARFEGEALFIVGRTKELIIRSGFNVYPAEVEAVLNAHPVGRPVGGRRPRRPTATRRSWPSCSCCPAATADRRRI